MKYKGNFCWHGEDFTLYTEASSKGLAFSELCHQLSKRLGYSMRHIYLYFKESPNKYRIEEEN